MSDRPQETILLPEPVVIPVNGIDDELLQTEWLTTNSVGAYSSSTVLGCNTRRYHGLLVAPTWPPVGRFCALATVMEELSIDGRCCKLATNEFPDAFSPGQADYLVEFRNGVIPTFVYRVGAAELTKEIVLADSAGAVAVRYTLRGPSCSLRLRPFVALRDFHHVRRKGDGSLTFEQGESSVEVRSLDCGAYRVHLSSTGVFQPDAGWWYDLLYRADIARGQDSREDLYTPGSFVCELDDGQSCELAASIHGAPCLDVTAQVARREARMTELVASVGAQADDMTRRLAMATDAFIVRRRFRPHAGGDSATVLAGYHWFADWGRDAFIALPGLLLSTGRFDLARQVFRTFADHMTDGMIPNRFDDYAATAHYNSIDASLWFIIAAERYLQTTGDMDFWRETLMPAAGAILDAYQNGTQFDIRADADGLLTGGSIDTQLTWMDVKLAGQAVTPRHGKAVEINALWHSAHRIMAARCDDIDKDRAERHAESAELIAAAFVKTFWNDDDQCLYDCISNGQPDASMRPNQIFAVSLPHSPLDDASSSAVVKAVAEALLTPMGLRTLARGERDYRRHYGGSLESRDRAYHQGTVWAWLMGPFIEAHLKVEGDKPFAVEQARQWMAGFDAHLGRGGLGFVSEIFDGDPPHAHRGCIAQAWSVAEVLRAKLLVEEYARKIG